MVRRIFSNTFTLLIVVWFVAAGVVLALNPDAARKTFFGAIGADADDTAVTIAQSAADVKVPDEKKAPGEQTADAKATNGKTLKEKAVNVKAADAQTAARTAAEEKAGNEKQAGEQAPDKKASSGKIGSGKKSTPQTASPRLGLAELFEQFSEDGGHASAFVDFAADNSPAAWFMFVSFVLAGWLLGRVVSAILASIGRTMAARGWTARSHLPADLASPAWLAVFTLGLSAGLSALMLHEFATPARGLLKLLYSLAAFWYVYNLVGVVEAGLNRLGDKTKMQVDEQLIVPIRKTLRIVVVVIAALFIFSEVFGWDVRAWLAGLGIAGLAVSLAAQDSLKNLFGSITILSDRPFRVGERIIYSGYDGVIEEIGFRSTKVRTGDGHLVSIPNSSIVNGSVENVGRRPFIKRTLNVTITYDTPRAKIEEAVEIIRKILEEDDIREPIHQSVGGNDYPPRVYFNDMTADSLNILVIYWFVPAAYWDYMEHAQRLNLRIFEAFERAGIEFSFPTQTLYLAGDEKRRLAVEMLGRDL